MKRVRGRLDHGDEGGEFARQELASNRDALGGLLERRDVPPPSRMLQGERHRGGGEPDAHAELQDVGPLMRADELVEIHKVVCPDGPLALRRGVITRIEGRELGYRIELVRDAPPLHAYRRSVKERRASLERSGTLVIHILSRSTEIGRAHV